MLGRFVALWKLFMIFRLISSYEVDQRQSPDEDGEACFNNLASQNSLAFFEPDRATHVERKMQSCWPGCSQCISSDYDQCTSCDRDYYFLGGECLKIYPNGFATYWNNANFYKLYSPLVFDITLNQILGSFNTKNSTYLICGNEAKKFYPNYDENDPMPTKDRGYYFNSSAYMQMAPNEWSSRAFIPNVNNTVSVWAYMMNYGDWSLFHKNSVDNQKQWAIRISSNDIFYEWTHLTNSQKTLSSYSYTISDLAQKWFSCVLTFEKANGAYSAKIYYNSALMNTYTYSSTDKFMWDEDGIFRIGYYTDNDTPNGVGWDGFIAKIAFYAVTLSDSEISSLYGTCTSTCNSLCPVSGDCFSTCDIDHYADSSGSCNGVCDSSCANPCVYPDRCSLCYNSTSDKCFGFGEKDTLSYSCANNCLSCTDGNYYSCTACNSGYYLHYGVCVKSCKSSYTAASGVCSGGKSYVYDFVLDQMSGKISDNYKFYSLTAGNDPGKFYPNPDSNDPIPSYQRGYYFNGNNNYLKLNDSITFDYYQTHGFWFKKEYNGGTQYLLTASDSSRNYLLQVYITSSDRVVLYLVLNNNPSTGSQYFQILQTGSFPISNGVWTFYSIVVTFVKGATYWRSYYYNERSVNSYMYDGIMHEAPCSMIFGAEGNDLYISNGFKGFIYEILYIASSYSSQGISQLFSSSCAGCDYCPLSLTTCLSTCGINYYEDAGSCWPCKASCKYGCVTNTTCNLCEDPGCLYCSSLESGSCSACYTNSTQNSLTSTCECDDSSLKLDWVSSRCSYCDSSCKVCIWPYMMECESCPSGYYLTNEKICSTYCASGCANSVRNSMFTNFTFSTSIDNKMLDSVYSIPIFMGNNASYYPTYDPNDPKFSPYRGLYFLGNSSAQLPPNAYNSSQLFLGFTHTIDMWIMPFSNGTWISKYHNSTTLFSAEIINNSLQVCYNFFSPSQNLKSLCAGYDITLNSWIRVTWTSSYYYGGQDLIINLDGDLVNMQTLGGDYFFNEDIYADFVLGHDCCGSYYTGYIYSLKFYNYIMSPSSVGVSCGCQSCTDRGECLSTCSFNEAYDYSNNICSSCAENCNIGCVASGKCTLCSDPLCSKCSSYNSKTCSTCKDGSYYQSQGCTCYSSYYYNSNLGTCEGCKGYCYSCTNSTYCNSCRNSMVLSNGVCACPSGKYYNSTTYSCQSCKSLCNFCSNSTDCSTCVENATLVGDTCYCTDGYTFDNNYCRQCSSCLTCSGVNIYECTSCLSEQYLTSEGICSSYCAYGCNDSQRSSAIVRYKFTNISNIFYDLENNVPMYMGLNSSYYPNYEESDPKILPYRGLYFDQYYSYAYLPPNLANSSSLYLGYSHTFDFWTYPMNRTANSEPFLNKSSSLIAYIGEYSTLYAVRPSYYLKNINNTQINTLSSIAYINANEWVRVSWSLNFVKGNTTFILYINGIEKVKQTASGYFYDESNDNEFYFGPFIGYLYSFDIYNYILSSFQMGNNDCGCQACSDLNECLSACNITEAYNKDLNICENCLSSCDNGCSTINSCNLCYDPACYECSSFESGSCTSCKPNASFDSSNNCICETGKYFNTSTDSCEVCENFCESCTSSDNCLSCLYNDTMIIDQQNPGNCICKEGMYLNESTCLNCADFCISCDQTECFECRQGSSTYIDPNNKTQCICNDGFYYNSSSFSCEVCKEPCNLCTNETYCLSCIDSSMTLNEGICTCPETKYFNYDFLSCEACKNQCYNCTSETECTSCVENAALNGTKCYCNDRFTPYNDTCATCYGYCKTCSGINPYECTSCFNNAYLPAEGICSNYHWLNCENADRHDVMMNFTFNGVSNYYGSVMSGLYFGLYSQYYPDYEEYDPKAVAYRGIYSNESTYGLTFFYFGLSHTFDTWIYIMNKTTETTSFISRYGFSAAIITTSSSYAINPCYNLTYFNRSKAGTLCTVGDINTNEWLRTTWTLEFFEGSTTLTQHLNGLYQSKSTAISKYFNEDGLGNGVYIGLFAGYFYSMVAYNYVLKSIEMGNNDCGCQACTDLNQCLSTCSFSEAYNKTTNSCESCLSSCINGCYTTDDCNLCRVPYCISCTSYEDWTCTDCISHASFSSSEGCKCSAGYHFNTTTETCEPCGHMCGQCTSIDNCLSCFNTNTMLLDSSNPGNCICAESTYYLGDYCYNCGYLCASCNSTQCLQCKDIPLLKIDPQHIYQCMCDDGYWYNYSSYSCETCKEPCKACSYENWCNSCIDSTMSLSYGSCTCQSKQYFNYTISSCKPCKESCLDCVSDTSCNTCVDNSRLIDNECICNSGYTPYNTDCYPCESCLECNGIEIYECTSCSTGEYLTSEGFCSSYCAYGCSDAKRNSIIANYTFLSISNVYYDYKNSIPMSLGNTSNFYPDYDYWDPKILPERGLYFNGSSYGQLPPNDYNSSQLYLGYSHSIDVWTYLIPEVKNNAILLTKIQGYNSYHRSAFYWSDSVLKFDLTYRLYALDKSNTNMIQGNSNITIEAWYRLTWTLEFTQGSTNLVLYSNGNYIEIQTLQNFFFDENNSNIKFYIGKVFDYCFKGYIYSLVIYNYPLSNLEMGNNDCGCQACSDLSQCLSTCNASEAYIKNTNQCEACPDNCEKGCLSSSYCGLCDDNLCSTCSDFSNSCISCVSNAYFTSSHSCECNSAYFRSQDLVSCSPCYKMCAECSGKEANKCTECVSEAYMMTNGYCVFYCPLGYSIDGVSCSAVNPNSLTVYFIFNQLSNTQLDSVSSLPIFFGRDSSFYPSYDENDPKVLKNRGLYFDGNSYATLFSDGTNSNPISFGFSHTFEMWVLVLPLTEDGIVISKYSTDSTFFLLKIEAQSQSYSISLCYNFTDINDGISANNLCISSQSYSYNSWKKISWTLESSNYDCELILYSFSDIENSATASNTFFDENTAAEVWIGSMRTSSFFKGYIYSLRIHNFAFGSINGASSCGCTICTEYDDCLIDCAYSEYYLSGVCTSCQNTCTNGCVSGDVCNLCDDPICSNCTSIESGSCVSCKENSSFDSNNYCLCNSLHYWNTTMESCESCGDLCGSCTSADNCQYCMDTYTMIIDQQNTGNCKCNETAYFNGTWCLFCGNLCIACNETDCEQCNNTSTMHVDPNDALACLCNDGYYYNSSTYTCEQCGDKCGLCSSSTDCSQCSEPDKMFISENYPGTCECEVGWIINANSCTKCLDSQYSNGTNCIDCGETCGSCLNSTFCLSCIDQRMSLDSGICSCSDGEYFNSTLLSCQPCKNHCLTCTSETSCISCVDNTNPISSNTCTCADLFYSDENDCSPCSSSCFNCTGAFMYQCTSCPQNIFLTSEGICSEYCAFGCNDLNRNSMILNITFLYISNKQIDSANDIPLYMGNSDSYYPNYDLNDPKIMPYRGLYFNGSSSALLLPNLYNSSQLYLGFSHTIDIWTFILDENIDTGTLMAKYYSDNYLLKTEFVLVDGIIKICYNLHSLDLSSVNELCLDSSISINSWLRLTWTLQFNSGSTSLSSFHNGVLINTIAISELYFYEAFNSTFILGNYDSSSYFYGYIYSVKIYNYAFTSISEGTNSCGCQQCSDLDQCLSACKYNEAYNITLNTCESCPSNCENGCTHSWACNLCDDFLCLSCDSYFLNDCSSCVGNAHLNGNSCECDTDYHAVITSMKCAMCTDFCDDCFAYAANQCISCISSYYLTSEGFCVLNCPLGYSYNGTMCISEDIKSLVLNYKFDQLLSTQKDEINQIPIEFGSTSSFYPNYDDNDPRVLQYRGLYFDGNQYAILPPNSAESNQIALGFSHTIDVWIMPISGSGTILSKYNKLSYVMFAEILGSSIYSISISYRLTDINDGLTTSYENLTSSGHSYLEWKRVSFSLNYSSEIAHLSLYINGNLENTDSVTDMFFDENSLAFINLGSYNLSSYYSGYIYSLKMYSYALGSFSQGTCECSVCTEDNNCLADCGKDKFYASNICESCLSTCTDGCIADNRCNLCSDPLCDTCSSFKENTCSACISNAIFDMVTDLCECSSGYIFNSTSEKCVVCSSLCNTCEGRFDNCSNCNDGYYMNSGGLCLMNCSLGFSVVDGSCQPDDPNSMVAYFHFNELANTIYDSVSSLAIYMGSSDSYYPDYDANDPKTLPYRGIYFSGNSIASLQPNSASSAEIILGISHSIELWMMPIPNSSYETLISKSTSSSVLMKLQLNKSGSSYDINACYTLLDTYTSSFSENLCVSSPTCSYNAWKKVTLSLSYELGLTKLELYVNGVAVGSSNISNYYYYENYETSFMLGTLNSDSYFTGFIYSLKFYNYAKWTVNKRELESGSSTCTCQECTDDGDCLTSCGANEYYDSSSKTCKACRSDCTNGCVRSTDCSLHPDEMCETYTTLESGKCTKCLANAINVPPCACDKHSSYSSSDRKCLCVENYQSFNNTCIYCWRYIQSSEISASFTYSFLKLVLTFLVSVNTTGATCSTLFPTNVLEKFGSGYSCNFNSDATTFTVNLGYNFTLTNENISLKQEILKQNNKIYCGYYPTNVTVEVEYAYSLPYPSAIIDAPSTVLYSCQNLTVSGYKSSGNVNHDLYYKWDISSNPSSSKLAKYSTGFQTSITQFMIPKTDLSDSIITITLTVRNYLSLTDTSSITVESVYSGLAVTFDKTVNYELLAIDYVTYAIGAISACETSNEFSISWTIDSVSGNTSAINEAYFWGNQTSSDFIIIPQRAFPPNINIVFKAIVIDSVKNLEGSGLLSLIINPASPVVKVSRTSGSFGIVDDLAIDASSSYDPNEYKPLSFQWSCTYIGNDCTNLLSDSSKESLNVPKNTLMSGIEYQFTLAVFENYNKGRLLADSKSESNTTIVLMTVDYSTPTVSIIDIITELQPTVVITNARLTLFAEISNASLYEFQWTLAEGGSISYESSLIDQYLIISKDSMEAGRYYTFNLLVSDGSHNSSYECKFYTNLPPNAGSFTVSPTSGIESQTVFKLEALNWVDEENNTPITYSYGYMNGAEYIYLNSKNQTSTYYTMFPYTTGKLTVFVEGFDSLGAFTRKTSEITISIDKNLDQSKLFTDIVKELNSSSPQAYPGLISRMAISILNRDWILYEEYKVPYPGQLDLLLDVLSVSLHWTKLGINSMSLMDTQEVNTYTNLVGMMTRNPYLNSTTTEIAVCDIIDLMISKIDTTKPFGDYQALNLVKVIDQSYVFNSTSLQNNTLALETALKTLDNIQELIASQMAVGETRSCYVGNIEVKVVNKEVGDLDGYEMKSSKGISGVSLPKDFSKVISSLTTSPYVSLLMNVLSPSNDHLSLSSSVVDFSIKDPNTLENLYSSSLPSNISVQIQSYNVKYSNFTPTCVFFDTVNKNWSTEGCTKSKLGDNYLICSCNHFTSFSVKDAAIDTWVDSNIGDTTDVLSFSDINETNAAGLYFCIGTLLAYGVVGFYAFRKDRKDEREEDEKRSQRKGKPVKITEIVKDIRGKQESSNYECVIGRTLRTDENSNKATEINDLKESVELSSVSFDSPRDVYINEWDRALEYQRKNTIVKENSQIKRWEQKVKEKHEFLSIIFIKDLTKPRISRATLLFFSLLGQMFFTGVFYKDSSSDENVTYSYASNNSTNSTNPSNSTSSHSSSDSLSDLQYKLNDFFIAIYSLFIMQALSTLLDYILTEKEPKKDITEIKYRKIKRKNKIRRYIGIAIALGLMLFFCWSIVLFSISFEESVSVKWVVNSGVSYALKIFVTSWFKWAFLAVLILLIEKIVKQIKYNKQVEKEKKEESISLEKGDDAVDYQDQFFMFPNENMNLKFNADS